MKPTQMTRKELFELIWSKPMVKAAADLGISDVGLKKVCDRHRIPVPGRGYWRKLETGKRVTRAHFRALDDPVLETVEIYGSPEKALSAPVLAAKREAQAKEAQPDQRVVVEPKPGLLHPAAQRTANALKRQTPREGVQLGVFARDCFRVSISSPSIERVLRILDAVARGAEARGMELVETEKGLAFRANGGVVELRLNERWNDSLGVSKLGALSLELINHYHDGLRRSWADGRTQRLEDVLSDFFVGVSAYGAAQKERSDEHARRRREWAEEERRRAEEERRRALDKERLEFLQERMDALDEAGRLERYVAHLRAKGAEPSAGDTVGRLIGWADSKIAALRHFASPAALRVDLEEEDLFSEEAT